MAFILSAFAAPVPCTSFFLSWIFSDNTDRSDQSSRKANLHQYHHHLWGCVFSDASMLSTHHIQGRTGEWITIITLKHSKSDKRNEWWWGWLSYKSLTEAKGFSIPPYSWGAVFLCLRLAVLFRGWIPSGVFFMFFFQAHSPAAAKKKHSKRSFYGICGKTVCMSDFVYKISIHVFYGSGKKS